MAEVREQDGAALTGAMTRRARAAGRPRSAPRRARILVLGGDRALLHRRRPARHGVLLLRRHPADVLPGLAARVHHQPDRHPDRRRHPAPAAGRGDGPRLHASWSRPGRRSSCVAAGALATSIAEFAASIPDIQARPADDRRAVAGLARLDRARPGRPRGPGAEAALATSTRSPPALVAPLQSIAVASLGVRRDDAHRVLPVDLHGHRPRRDPGVPLPARAAGLRRGGAAAPDVRLALVRRLPARPGGDGPSSTSPSRSARTLLLGLPLAALTSVASGLLQMIPFFGPFISWAPPVIVALRLQPESRCCRRVILMGVGWFVVMNVLQPRIMQGAVGIHPIVVLGSVLIGGSDRGHPGCDLRDPDRRRRVGVLLPVPPPDVRRPNRHRTGGKAPVRTRRATGPHPARARPGHGHRYR